MPHDEVDLLRSVLAHAYEKPSPFPLRLVEAVQDYIGTRTPKRPIIQSLNISEKKDAHDWRELYRGALFELDPVKLLERIREARNALLDQIADLSKSINREQYALRSALETLRILQELAERDLSERNKPVRLVGAAGSHMDIQIKYGWQELYE